MPHLPIITNTWRCTLNWNSVNGVTPRNVMHVVADWGSQSAGDVFNLFDGNVGGDMWACMKDAYVIESLTILKMDGITPGSDFLTDGSTKWQGQSTGEIVPNVSSCVSLKTAERGRRRRGRVFVGPCTESVFPAP